MTKMHTLKLTDAEVRKITKLAVADAARQAKAVAAKHKARPENRRARLALAEAEVAATMPRDSRLCFDDMVKPSERQPARPRVRKQRSSEALMSRAGLRKK